ncbi:MAG: PilN domain-containing protein [Cellvibrionaceae bacterium]|nr:PilN domain-containing protein [Cellvibrionaceae bacterium]MCV6627079.1 PilN domain-containing protein [Cellvibrionaceae bacterium]
MKLNTNDLTLFGYDLSGGFAGLSLAWRELLWSEESPLAAALAETVALINERGELISYYRAGELCQLVRPEVETHALLLDDAKVLQKRITVPEGVEAELANVIELEVAASSPFGLENTALGWRLAERSAGQLQVDVAMVNKLDAQLGLESCRPAQEAWAGTESGPVVIRGFGESKRLARQGKRLGGIAWRALLIVIVLCCIPAMVSAFRYMQVEKLQASYQSLKTSSAAAIEAREKLQEGNALLQEARRLSAANADPLQHFQIMSEHTADDVWLRSFKLNGNTLQISGYALNTSELIGVLSNLPPYQQVKQRGGIRRDRRKDRDIFTLDISIRPQYKEGGQE